MWNSNRFTLLVSPSPTQWVKVFPIKFNIFALPLSLDKLPTIANLIGRGMNIPYLFCPLCDGGIERLFVMEVLRHVFFVCPIKKEIMNKVFLMVVYAASDPRLVFGLVELVHPSSPTLSSEDLSGLEGVFIILGGIFGTLGIIGCLVFLNRERQIFLTKLLLDRYFIFYFI